MTEGVAPAASDGRYRFGLFAFDSHALELRKNDHVVRVRPQSLKLLSLLLARRGQVVHRDQIETALWGRETFVDFEQGVNHAIRELRAVLGDNAESPRFIQTFARRGYAFIAPVEPLQADSGTLATTIPGGIAVGPPEVAVLPASGGRRDWRRWVLIAGLPLVAIGVLLSLSLSSRRDVPAATMHTIAVVPFVTSDTDPALSVGLASAIAMRLGTQRRAFVRSAPALSGQASPSGDDADLRGATLVLTGDVSRKGDEIAVSARLENVATGQMAWTERFQLRRSELHNLEEVVAERVVTAMNLQLAATDQERLRRRYTADAAAYEDYLRGRALLVRYQEESTLGAVAAFESAVRRDPGYALARAGLAMACADMCLRFAQSRDVDRWGQRAEAEARAALDLDPNLAEAHLARAAVARKREFDWNQVIVSSKRALVLNPNLDQAHFFAAAAYGHTGYMEEALIEVRNGERLQGRDAVEALRQQGIIALWSGHFAPAKVHLEEVSRLSDRSIADTYLALAYYYSGSRDQGRAILESLSTSSSASTASRSAAALASVLGGTQAAVAREHIDRVRQREYRDHHVAYNLGTAYAQIGDASEALQWLRTAADTGFPCLIWFERDPLLDPLRPDARFAALLDYVRSKREAALR